LYQYQTQQTAYTISDAYCITGELKVPSLERAFRKLLSRHEALRTIFKEVDGVAYQAVRNLDEVPSILEFKDIRGAIDIARCQREEIDELFMHVFDLVKGPLLRCKILQVDTNVYVLIVVISHIIADAWSMKILFSDLVSLYELELGNDTKSKLVPIAIQLKEYSLWLNNLQKTSKYEEDRKYWLDQFSDDHLPVLDINRASPRPPVRSFTGRTIRFSLNKSLTADIVRFCEQVGATPYMVLLAQINTLLYCHSGSKEIVVGNPVSGRMRSEFENVIGLFVITLPIKCKFKAQNTFGELVDIVKESTLNAYLHELYPLDELIGEINANVDQSRSPLFDVMVQLQDRSIASSVSNVKSLEISEERIEHFSSKFDLTFDFKIRTEHIDVVLEYNSILFDEDFIRVFQDDFLMIVEAVLKDPTITPQRIRKERMSLDVNQVQDFRNI
jgi:hypothetical protein